MRAAPSRTASFGVARHSATGERGRPGTTVTRSGKGLPPASGALVLGGDRMALGIVRSLGRAGVPCWVLADPHFVASTSRYAARTLSWSAGCERAGVERLLELAIRRNLRGWVVIPTGDAAASLLARNHAVLSKHLRLATPPWSVLRWAYDKRLTYRLAGDLGIPYPRTVQPATRDEVAEQAWGFPIILKPASKPALNRFTRAKAWRADDRWHLLSRYDEAVRLVDPSLILLQEIIPGGGERQFSFAALCRDGEVVASVTARRARQYPIEFGYASSYVETIESDTVERTARRLLSAMEYSGLAEVEFKLDPRDDTLKLLEVNPRVWAWHTLGRRAGVDFPLLQYRLLIGDSLAARRGRPGVRWLRLATDLLAAWHEMRQGKLSFGEYARSFRAPLEWAVFAADDPLPALVDLPLMAYAEVLTGRRAARSSPPAKPSIPRRESMRKGLCARPVDQRAILRSKRSFQAGDEREY